MINSLLIVDDNASMRRLIRSIVKDLVVNIHECGDGDEALEIYRAVMPDLVLMDVEMARKDGLTATREIVESDPQAKVLILTKYDTARMREEAKRAGASAYVLKENLLSLKQIIRSYEV